MTTFNGLIPSSSSQGTIIYRVQEYQYGNGYKGVAPDGANATITTYQINFDNLDSARATTLETWLGANQPWVVWSGDGTVLPSNRSFRVTKDGYQKNPQAGNVWSYQFNVEQVF